MNQIAAVHGAGNDALPRWRWDAGFRYDSGTGSLGGARESAGPGGGVPNQSGSDAPDMPISSGGGLSRDWEHGRSGKFRLREAEEVRRV